VLGASASNYLEPGEWLLSASARGLRSNDHYNGIEEQVARHERHNYVVNEQYLLDLSATYIITQRASATLAVPIVQASWSIPLPAQPVPGERNEQNARGIGDISATARFWLGSPEKHPRGNVSLGVGVKAPTGDHRATDSYPDLTGGNEAVKPVDQSIQPGDGGWGLMLDVQGFKRIGTTMFYASGTYLANPRNENGTPSLLAGLGLSGNAAFYDRLVNSVPDQYLLRAGASFALGKGGWSGALGLRMEGMPRYDLFGASNGFRRPGYEVFAEPSVYFARGPWSWSLSVPIGIQRNRLIDPNTALEGDATFPDYIVLTGTTYRFGGVPAAAQ
jgi:hypothetical protein